VQAAEEVVQVDQRVEMELEMPQVGPQEVLPTEIRTQTAM
jgi:hypothetical protein